MRFISLLLASLAFGVEPDSRDAEIAALKRQIQWQEHEALSLKLAIISRDFATIKAQAESSKAKLCEADKVPLSECELDQERHVAVRKVKQ